jgi:hypothetical protein
MAKESKAMIIEYRKTDRPGGSLAVASKVLRTYKDVTAVRHGTGDATVFLYGTTPPLVDEKGVCTTYAYEFFIACIHLAAGEYLERVDVPRD